MRYVVVALIQAYRWMISPLLGTNCRFNPPCSQYAREAVLKHGAIRGVFLAGTRIARCHPWHPGGVDPVP